MVASANCFDVTYSAKHFTYMCCLFVTSKVCKGLNFSFFLLFFLLAEMGFLIMHLSLQLSFLAKGSN